MQERRRPRTGRAGRALAALVAIALHAAAVRAGDTAIALAFEAEVEGTRPVLEDRALDLGLAEDARPDATREEIGRKTRGATVTRVTTSDDPGAFVAAAARAALPAWGARLDPAAGAVLDARVVRFDVEEAWGFVARVKVRWTLHDAQGSALYDKTLTGTAKRGSVLPNARQYNAILSAAALDAVARLAGDPEFRAALGAKRPAPPPVAVENPAPPAGAGRTPEAILAELERLAGEGLGEPVLDAYLRRQTFSRAMSADDLVAWKRAGLTDGLIRIAIEISSAPKEP